ncbi:MAG: twin-arginine translocase TatA/TatE family subunit [Chloroflexota bacterium]|jgi:sec-independent protein translocase protein TatB
MEILGIGPQELVVIFIIALIVLGPKDMQKAGKTIGKWLNDLVHSDGWKLFQTTSREIRNLPTNLMREANLDEITNVDRDLRGQVKPPQDSKPFTIGTPPTPPSQAPAPKTEPAPGSTPPAASHEQDVNG